MNKPRISGIFRIPLYLVSIVIIGILSVSIYKTRPGSDVVTFYPRLEPGDIHATLNDAQRVKRTWGSILNPEKAVPEEGITVYYLTSGDLADIDPSYERQVQLAKRKKEPVSLEEMANLLTAEPKRLIGKGQRQSVQVHRASSTYQHIPTRDFAAYWVGWLNIAEKGEYEFVISNHNANTRVTLDGRRMYAGIGAGIPIHTPIRLAPGRYLLEVEMTNNLSLFDFSVAVNLLREAP